MKRMLSSSLRRGACSSTRRAASSCTNLTSAVVTKTRQEVEALAALLASYPVLQHTPWVDRLEGAIMDLTKKRRSRIAIVGDQQSGVCALVTAGFAQPFSHDEETLYRRRMNSSVPEKITIESSENAATSKDRLGIPSKWLNENKVEIVEIVHQDLPPTQSSIDAIYSSDVLLLLLDSTRTLSPPTLRSLLQQFSSKPNLILVIDSPASEDYSSPIHTIEAELDLLRVPRHTSSCAGIASISTTVAMDALGSLALDDPSTFEIFQSQYLASQVVHLKDRLATCVTPSTSNLEALHTSTAGYTLDRAIDAAAVEGAKMADVFLEARGEIAALEQAINQITTDASASLGVVDGRLQVPVDELRNGIEDIQRLFGTETLWWKLPWRADDITSDISALVSHRLLRDFEDRLIFDAGRMIAIAAKMTARTDEMLATSAFSPTLFASSASAASLHSTVLVNQLSRAAASSASSSPVTELSSPVVLRRHQVICAGGPAEVLQSRAQKMVASAGSLSTGSIIVACYSEWSGMFEMATNIGGAMLGTVASAWMLQRSWETAKKCFFVDIEHRVMGGLEEDLASSARRMLDRASYVPRLAIAGSKEILRKKDDAHHEFVTRLESIVKRRDLYKQKGRQRL